MVTVRTIRPGSAAKLVALGVAVALAAPAPAPATAAAAGRTVLATIGPLRSSNGTRMSINAADCGQRDASVSVDFQLAKRGSQLSYVYTGPGTCSLTADGVGITASWTGILSLKVEVDRAGRPRGVRGPTACSPLAFRVSGATITGTIAVAIQPAVLGTVIASSASGQLVSLGTPACKLPIPTPGPAAKPPHSKVAGFLVTAQWPAGRGYSLFGPQLTVNDLPGSHNVELSEPGLDRAAPGVKGEASLTVCASALKVDRHHDRATIDVAGPYVDARLTFAATERPRSETKAVNGRLVGTITFNDPILGRSTLSGAAAQQVELSPLERGSSAGSFTSSGGSVGVVVLGVTTTTATGASASFDSAVATLS